MQSNLLTCTLIFTSILFSYCNTIYAQDPSSMLDKDFGSIVTDRPDQTEASCLTPKGWIQIETGMMVENDKSGGIESREIVLNTTLIKYGISDKLELRIIQEYLKSEIANEEVGSGMGPLAVGARFALAEEKGFWPEIAFIGHLSYRTGDDFYKPNHVTPDFRFSIAHTLSNTLSIGYNLGAEWNGVDANPTGIYTFTLAASATKRIGCFVEVYGFLAENEEKDHRFDGGVTYLLNNNFQLDVSGGIGLSEISPDSFLSAGLSWRFSQ